MTADELRSLTAGLGRLVQLARDINAEREERT
jgi:hypothetical protein